MEQLAGAGRQDQRRRRRAQCAVAVEPAQWRGMRTVALSLIDGQGAARVAADLAAALSAARTPQRASWGQIGSTALRLRRGDPPGAVRRAYRVIWSSTATPRASAATHLPKNRGLLRREFVARLARIADTSCALLLLTPQNPSAQWFNLAPTALRTLAIKRGARPKTSAQSPALRGMMHWQDGRKAHSRGPSPSSSGRTAASRCACRPPAPCRRPRWGADHQAQRRHQRSGAVQFVFSGRCLRAR